MKGQINFARIYFLDDYKLDLRLMDSLLKSTWEKKKNLGNSSQMSVKNVKEKGSFYNQYIV